jgi:hypothetical protein
MTMTASNPALIAAGVLSLVASGLHLAIIFGGAGWYRFFGAGERFARAAERGEVWPGIATFGIALVLFVWALYAFSGAGALPALPMLRTGLVLITAVYLLRGAVVLPLLLFARGTLTPFVVWSSLICLGYGLVHLLGVLRMPGVPME